MADGGLRIAGAARAIPQFRNSAILRPVGLYTRDSIERVKDAIDMVELVSARTDLRRVGTRHTGLCPFHDERTPSFSVNAEHKLYHCFGCGESGDAIGFVQATEALEFKEAVEHLAERYGVELKREQEDPRAEERRRRRERLLKLVDRAASWYARFLWESGEAAKARQFAARMGRVIAVEGYTDVLALHQAGISEAVAIMGTALTEEQLAELHRAAGTVFLGLDADSAGQDAMLRVARSAEKRGVELRVVAMPEGTDPAELVADEGPDSFRQRLDHSLSVAEFEVRRALDSADLATTRGRDKALLDIRPLIAAVPPKTRARGRLEDWIASKLDVPLDYVEHEFRRTKPQPTFAPRSHEEPAEFRSVNPVAKSEKTLLAMCLAQP